jgi:glycosyltransferase involved in cell wall biosynthesis
MDMYPADQVNVNKGERKILAGHDIIYFGPGKWDGMWRNRHQLMSRFARYNNVMYVEPIFTIHKLRKQLRRGYRGISEIWHDARHAGVTKAAENLYIYHSPAYIPISGRFPLDKITWWVWNLLFKQTMKRLGFIRPIIWLSQPNMSCFIGNFNEKLIIYHVVDEYLSYGEMDVETRAKVEKLEQQVLEKADLVIVVSEKLHATKSVLNKHTYLVPNGVDYASYSKALTDDTPMPSDISQLPKPVIGYSGLISRRLDLGLIGYIAKSHTEWSLVLIGEVNDGGCESELNRLREMKNVYFLGIKEITQVPHYVRVFDVCIVPYKLNEQTENLSPLKLYDFMAMGKEIVTTDFPIAREFKDILHIAKSKETFVNCIVKTLSEKNKSLFAKRRQIAAQNTWEDRIVELSGIIESHL